MKVVLVTFALLGVLLVHAAPSLKSIDIGRFEKSIDPFLNAIAETWAKSIQKYGPVDKADIAYIAKDALRKSPLAIDVESLRQLDDCDDCKAEVRRVQSILLTPAVKDRLGEVAKQICRRFNLFSDYICDGTVDLFQNIVLEIVAHSTFEPLEVCSNQGLCPLEPMPTWNVTFAKPKPAVRSPPRLDPLSPKKYILQLTDIHYDPSYTPGLEALCGDPLCCRPPNPAGVSRPAGIFGDFNCDSPRRLIEDVLSFISTSPLIPEISLVFVTGDTPPHDVWESSREGYTALMNDQAKLLQTAFPNIPVYWTIGNHESVPVDEFAPLSITEAEFSSQWLYDVLAEQWSVWLPVDAQEQLKRGGSFTTLIQTGLRLVSINDEGCSSNNWWLRMRQEGGCCKNEYSDPDNTLHWLADVLQQAEDNNERVFLLRHVSNNGRCNRAWSNNFYSIIVRYENQIISIHSGHSHDDYFSLYYRDDAQTEAVAVTYISPAVTPYTNGNPAFRLYEVDWNTFDIVNTFTYITNLTESNQLGRTNWFLEYSSRESYRMSTASAQEWHNLTVRFEQDQVLFDRYYNNKLRSNPQGNTCSGACRTNEVCELRKSRTGDTCPEEQPEKQLHWRF